MASNKRRKVEPQEGPVSAVSAFAARKSLWGAPASSSSIKASGQDEDKVTKQEAGSAGPSAGGQRRGNVEAGSEADTILATSIHDPNERTSLAQTSSVSAVQSASNDLLPRVVLQHSSFRPTKRNYQEKAHGRTIIKPADGERLVILGSYSFKICEGEVTIAGATLRPDTPIQRIHAPHCHALPVIRATKDSTVEVNSHPAASGLRALGKLSQVFERLWNEDLQPSPGSGSNKHGDNSFQIIYTSDDGPKRAILQDLVSPAEWNKKIAELALSQPSRPPVVFICGPKSSGKSTFGKILANRFITQQGSSRKKSWHGVAVLDLDPGQPEYSAPGAVSLVHVSKPNLAPSFCHPHGDPGNTILRSHAIASVTPALDPEHYLECALNLFNRYQNNTGTKSPLIVNTPGWIQGTGLDILLRLIENIRPTEVIYMSQDGPGETVDGLRTVCQDIPLSTLPSQESEYTSRTAVHFRTMQAMSYFHTEMSSNRDNYPCWDPRPLADMPPWRVRFKGESQGFLGLLCYDYQPPPNLLVEAINGMVVGLAVVEEGRALRDLLDTTPSADVQALDFGSAMELDNKAPSKLDSISQGTNSLPRTPEGIPFIPNPNGRTLDPMYSRMVGLALVRGIDVRRGELHILTPLSANIIATLAKNGKNLVLVAGKFDTPSWAYTEDLYKRSSGGSGVDTRSQGAVEVTDEDTDDDSSQGGYEENVASTREYAESPWVELLYGNQKRTVGSRVWRVRRDLGRGGDGP